MRLRLLLPVATLPALSAPGAPPAQPPAPVIYVQVTPAVPDDSAPFLMVDPSAPGDTAAVRGGVIARLLGEGDGVLVIAAPGRRLRAVVTDSAAGRAAGPAVELVARIVQVHWTSWGADARGRAEPLRRAR